MNKFKHFLGIDVSKEFFDAVLILEGKKEHPVHNQFINNYKGIRALVKWLRDMGATGENTLVCLEHTGMYGKLIIKYLIGFNFSLWVEMSLRIIKSIGIQRGKNDKIDAERIAFYALKNVESAVIYRAPRQVVDKIRTLLSLRDKLTTNKLRLLQYDNEMVDFDKELTKISTKFNKNTLAGIKKDLLSIEKQSEHPLAEAVVNYLKDINTVHIHHIESLTGKGVKANYKDINYLVGNQKLLTENQILIDNSLKEQADKWLHEAKTVIWFADDKKALAVLAIADEIKETSIEAIKELQKMGIEVHMLTGDNYNTAKAIAEKTGISSFKGEVLPKDKADFVKELQAKGKIVAMVGDGINDSTALAQANVSIAMGKGSDIAIDVAKMTIISSDLMKISTAIKLSKSTVNTIKQNLFWAFIYNVVGIPIAAGILYPINGFLLNPMIAGAAMALSSISVVGNSLRLKYFNN